MDSLLWLGDGSMGTWMEQSWSPRITIGQPIASFIIISRQPFYDTCGMESPDGLKRGSFSLQARYGLHQGHISGRVCSKQLPMSLEIASRPGNSLAMVFSMERIPASPQEEKLI